MLRLTLGPLPPRRNVYYGIWGEDSEYRRSGKHTTSGGSWTAIQPGCSWRELSEEKLPPPFLWTRLSSLEIRKILFLSDTNKEARERLEYEESPAAFNAWCKKEGFETPLQRERRYRAQEIEQRLLGLTFQEWLRERGKP